jgi:hypothetical protein
MMDRYEGQKMFNSLERSGRREPFPHRLPNTIPKSTHELYPQRAQTQIISFGRRPTVEPASFFFIIFSQAVCKFPAAVDASRR